MRPDPGDTAAVLALFAPPGLEERMRAHLTRVSNEAETSSGRGERTAAEERRRAVREQHDLSPEVGR